MTSDERLLAYLDNELPPEDRAHFEAEMAKDERLAEEVAKHRGLAAKIAEARAQPVKDKPGQRRKAAAAASDRTEGGFEIAPLLAMAACLVAGALGAHVLWPQPGPLGIEGGAVTAQGRLEKTLTSGLGGQPGPVKVGLTFKTRAGHFCRTFESTPDRIAGVACRAGGSWLARTVTGVTPTGAAAAGQPSLPLAPAVQATVDATIDGAPLDAAAERAARAKNWN